MTHSEHPTDATRSHAEAIAAGAGTTTPPVDRICSGSIPAPWAALRPFRASFEYDESLGVHIAVCSAWRWRGGHIVRCGNGPLNQSELPGGICSEGPHVVTGHEPPY